MTVLGAVKFFRDTYPRCYPMPPGSAPDAIYPIKLKQWEEMVDYYVAGAGLSGTDMETFRTLCEAGLKKGE